MFKVCIIVPYHNMAVSHSFLLFMTLIVVYASVYTFRSRNYNIVTKLGCCDIGGDHLERLRQVYCQRKSGKYMCITVLWLLHEQ